MKRTAAVVAAVLAMAGLVHGDNTTNMTSYFSNYQCLTNSTDLGTGTNWVCIAVSDVSRLTQAKALDSGVAADIMRGLIKEFYDQQELLASTNQLDKFTIQKNVVTSSGTADYTEKYSITVEVEDTTSGSFVEAED